MDEMEGRSISAGSVVVVVADVVVVVAVVVVVVVVVVVEVAVVTAVAVVDADAVSCVAGVAAVNIPFKIIKYEHFKQQGVYKILLWPFGHLPAIILPHLIPMCSREMGGGADSKFSKETIKKRQLLTFRKTFS